MSAGEWVITTGDGVFNARSPKADAIRAVKLTEKNVREVAAYILKALGGKVEVVEGQWITQGGPMAPNLYIDRWVVEEYDYVAEAPRFRHATQAEREKYDLR